MNARLQTELRNLRQSISRQGHLVTRQIDNALEALLAGDRDKSLEVINTDDLIDRQEVMIEEDCLKVIALHQPVARDLRLLVTVLKVNNDMERIADHAVNIAFAAEKFIDRGISDFPPQIIKMGGLVTEMCRSAINAFVYEAIDMALAVSQDDKAINKLCGLVYDEAKRILNLPGDRFGHAIRIYRVGRELERVGDLSKNIAEDTVYLITGDVVRHSRRNSRYVETPGSEGT